MDTPALAPTISDAIFPYLPLSLIEAAYRAAPGNEIASGKFFSSESSAALVANTFGLFLDDVHSLPPLPQLEDAGWPALHVRLEATARFPWRGGRHPCLDVLVETTSHLIGIESKRFEPFRNRSGKSFSDAYWWPVWGEEMRPFEGLRDRLADGSLSFVHLDAVQLIKTAFGLRTEANKKNKRAILFYLYAEPERRRDGRLIGADRRAAHRAEVARFQAEVAGAEVEVRACSYRRLLHRFRNCHVERVRRHADNVANAFAP
jgi:hypothetical protein